MKTVYPDEPISDYKAWWNYLTTIIKGIRPQS